MVDYTEHIFAGSSVDLNYAEFKGDGPPLVVSHGFSTRWQGHLAYVERLSNYHVFAVDHAGHGMSGSRKGTYKLLDFADDMTEFIEQVVGHNVSYFGASLGALVGIAVAGTKPELIKTLVLGDAPFSLFFENYMGSWLQKMRAETREQLKEPISVEEEKKKIAAADPSLTAQQVENRALAMSQLRPESADALADGSFPDGWDAEANFRKTTAMTLILQGEPSTGGFQPDSDVARMQELYADSTAVKFYGLGHGLDYGTPGAPFDSMKGFLDAHT